jgi:hypothetical protein
LRAMRASEVPKPEEQPVMSQTSGLLGEDIMRSWSRVSNLFRFCKN